MFRLQNLTSEVNHRAKRVMQLSRIKVNPLREYQNFRFNPYTRTSRSITLKPTELLITLEDQRVHDHMQIQGRVLDKYDPRTIKVVVHYAPTSGYAWYTLWATRNCLFLQWASMSKEKRNKKSGPWLCMYCLRVMPWIKWDERKWIVKL